MPSYSFLIPLVDNNSRKPHPAEYFAELEHKLLALFGGFTDKGIVRGCWRDETGETICDESREYVVASGSMQGLIDLLVRCCDTFGQQCIYLSTVYDCSVLVHSSGTVEQL